MIKKHANVIEFSTTVVDNNTCAGIDEAGRGPLAGPVLAAAVILGNQFDWSQLRDSKALTAAQRAAWAQIIKQQARAWAVGRCEVDEIDTYNIFNASLMAMQRAFAGLNTPAELALVDGKYSPELGVTSYAVIKGDQKAAAISAASIVAKVTRDEEMTQLDSAYPQYGFAGHKGYPTARHLQALEQHGPCCHHRQSFKPVARLAR